MKIRFSDRVIKKFAAAVMSLAMAVSMVSAAGISAYAEEEAPVLYLEVSSTLTAQDSFAWTAYDHYNYRDRYLPTLPQHITYEGNNIKMIGYSVDAFKDFLFVEDDNDSRKILSFDLQRDSSSWHTVESGGFLFNSSIKNGTLQGFAVLVTGSGMQLVQLTGVNLSSFRSGKYETIASTGKLLGSYSMSAPYQKHHIKIEASKKTVSVWDDDRLVIDKYELPENDYGYGYGPITSYYSHACSQQSSFTFSNIKMETVTGYYIKLETVPDEWGYTEDYWTETFTLTNVEYTPSEDETIANFDEYPLFKNAKDMILVYPDGTYECTLKGCEFMQNAVRESQVIVIPARAEVKNNVSQRQLNVAAYCRVSTDEDEQETSFEAQISYYTDKINGSADWRMVGIFADEGITGTVDTKRPEFLKMIRLCRNKKIDLILTKSISRFARNTVDCLKYVRELKSLGIGVIFEKENIDTMRIDSEMLLTVMSSFAQAESESISKNVSWGIRQSFKSGKVPINYKFMLGYRKGADGRPEIVPDEAETVKEIFRKYLDGCSQNQIADYLNGRGITTKTGSKWRDVTVSNVLTNEKYTGDALLQKTYVLDCISKKRCINNGELPKYLVKDHHEPIISHLEFDRVQAEMARRKSKRKVAEKLTKTENGKYSAKFALSELLICGECGTPYRRVTWTAKGFKEIKWRCINRLQYGKKYCHNSPTIAEETLHNAIVDAINKFCEVQSEVSQTLRESLTEVLDPNLNGSVKAAQERISELSRNIDELIKLAAGGNTEQSMADIQKFSNEMTALREFIESEKAKQSAAEKDNQQLETVLDMLEKEDFRLTEYDDVAVRHLIEYIKVIDKNTLLICFKGGFEVRKELNIGN